MMTALAARRWRISAIGVEFESIAAPAHGDLAGMTTIAFFIAKGTPTLPRAGSRPLNYGRPYRGAMKVLLAFSAAWIAFSLADQALYGGVHIGLVSQLVASCISGVVSLFT